jgi:hypothetical protein
MELEQLSGTIGVSGVPRDQTGALIKVFPGNIGIGQVITPRSEL